MIARRLLIIDIASLTGGKINTLNEFPGKILIPGFGPYFGLLSTNIDEYAPQSNYTAGAWSCILFFFTPRIKKTSSYLSIQTWMRKF